MLDTKHFCRIFFRGRVDFKKSISRPHADVKNQLRFVDVLARPSFPKSSGFVPAARPWPYKVTTISYIQWLGGSDWERLGARVSIFPTHHNTFPIQWGAVWSYLKFPDHLLVRNMTHQRNPAKRHGLPRGLPKDRLAETRLEVILQSW